MSSYYSYRNQSFKSDFLFLFYCLGTQLYGYCILTNYVFCIFNIDLCVFDSLSAIRHEKGLTHMLVCVLGGQRFFILKLDYLNRESSGHALFVLIFKVENSSFLIKKNIFFQKNSA